MKLVKLFFEIFSGSISLASIIFMGFVFWGEVHGHAVTYIEPNLSIATSELGLCFAGFGVTLGMYIRRLRE